MENTESNKPIPRFLFSVRFLLAFMAFLGYCIQYMLKINLGIAIVCMVNFTAINKQPLLNETLKENTSFLVRYTIENKTLITDKNFCLIQPHHGKQLEGSFVWSKSIQGFTLASYFWGYIITQIPGGYLSAKYGGKNVLVFTNLIASVLTIITPFCARGSYITLSICRFFIGLAHGVFWPAMSSIFVYWTPAKERTKIIGTSTSGAWVGNIIALPLGGVLCVSGFDGGWPSIFYIFGIIGVVWSGCFMYLISDSPQTHRFISKEEMDYIVEETKKEVSAKEGKKLATPWKEIFLSKVCWATFIAHLCNNWGNYLYLTQLPSFMKDVLKFDIKSNGLMSALPYVACAISTAALATGSEKLLHLGYLSRTNLRRIFNGVGLVGPLILIICLSFVTCSTPYLGVAFLIIGLALNGFYWAAGPLVNINDIGGAFAGVVFGITNTFGTFPGIVCPYIVGLITKNQTQKEWQIVFIICALVYFIGALTFWFFADSNLQSWAQIKKIEDQPKIENGHRNIEFFKLQESQVNIDQI